MHIPQNLDRSSGLLRIHSHNSPLKFPEVCLVLSRDPGHLPTLLFSCPHPTLVMAIMFLEPLLPSIFRVCAFFYALGPNSHRCAILLFLLRPPFPTVARLKQFYPRVNAVRCSVAFLAFVTSRSPALPPSIAIVYPPGLRLLRLFFGLSLPFENTPSASEVFPFTSSWALLAELLLLRPDSRTTSLFSASDR